MVRLIEAIGDTIIGEVVRYSTIIKDRIKYRGTEISKSLGFREEGFYPALIDIDEYNVSKENYHLTKDRNNSVIKPCLVHVSSQGIREFDIISPAIQEINPLSESNYELKLGHPDDPSTLIIRTENAGLKRKLEELV